MKEKVKVKGRFLRVLLSVIVIAVSVFALVSSAFVDRSDREFFGYGAFTLEGKNKSSVLIMKRVKDPVLKTGDIVLAKTGEGVSLREIGAQETSKNGESWFVTLDPETGEGDDAALYADEVEKVSIAELPYLGSVLGFIKTTPGFIVAVFAPVALLVILRVWDAFAKVRALRGETAKEEVPPEKKPVAPVVEKPAAPVFEEPAAPVFEEPVAPVVEKPVEPIFEKPVAPVVEKPVEPVFEEPVAPVFEEPAAPAVEEPSRPVSDYDIDELLKSISKPEKPKAPEVPKEPEYKDVTMEDMLEKLRKMREELGL